MANAGEIKARITLENEQFKRKMAESRQELQNTSKSSKQLSKDMAAIQRASLAVATAIGVGVGSAVTVAANFEKQMSAVKAVSGATADEMEKLTQLAMDLGESTAFSAGEAAQGIEELIKAGVTVEQILNGGLQGALDLAAAGNLGLAEAAEIASTALNAFRDDSLSVVDAANVLAGAANASATDVSELRFGLSQVSAVASGVGMSFKDTATALAVFAQNGLKGSDAGTSLKTMLQNLQPTTKQQIELFEELGLMAEDGTNKFFDQEGQLRSLSEIAGILRESMEGMTDQQRMLAMETIFGSDAIRAANVLYKEGADGIENMWDAMSKVTAAEVAETKLDNLAGAFEEFQGALETLGITIGSEFLPVFTDIVRWATDVVRSMGDIDGKTVKAGIAFAGTAATIALVVSTVVKLVTALRTLALSMGPAGWIITALSLLGGAVMGVKVAMEETEVSFEELESQFRETQNIDASIDRFEQLRAKMRLSNEELARFVDINSLLRQTADPQIIEALRNEQNQLLEKSGLTNEEFAEFLRLNEELIQKLPDVTKEITDQGNALVANAEAARQLTREKYEQLRIDLEAKRDKLEMERTKNLERQKELIATIKKAEAEREKIAEKIEVRESNIRRFKEEIKALEKENTDEARLQIAMIEKEIVAEEEAIQKLLTKKAYQSEVVKLNSEELRKIEKKIGDLDKVNRKLVEIELQYAGINAESGKELTTIDAKIRKLEEEKAKLEETTPAARKNTEEYRDQVANLDKQIERLKTAQSNIQEIIEDSQTLNAELAKTVTKEVRVRTVGTAELLRGPQRLTYHTGGIVPKLHIGGTYAQRFQNMPMHDEVDVRIRPNEMILTEAQQASLFRLLDSYIPSQPINNDSNELSRVATMLAEVAGRPIQVELTAEGRKLAEVTVDPMSELLDRKAKQTRRGRGL